MAYVDVTFERGASLVKTIARIAAGWDGSKHTYQFYGEQDVDFRGGVTLRVKVWVSGSQCQDRDVHGHTFGRLDIFPSYFSANYDTGLINARIASGCLSLSVLLHQHLSWIMTSNGKAAIDWQPGQIALHENVGYVVRHMIVFNLPIVKRGDYKEWDLLPFLPGGLVERNRRHH